MFVSNEAMGKNGVEVAQEIGCVKGHNINYIFYQMGIDVDSFKNEDGATKAVKLEKHAIVELWLPSPQT